MPSTDNPSVVFLPAWYPHRGDSMLGLFVQRHAEALATKVPVSVLYLHAEENKKNKGIEATHDVEAGVNTFRIYYKASHVPVPLLASLLRFIGFLRAARKGFRALRENDVRIDILHVHVLTSVGLLALWKKLTKGTPYVITEHWSRYQESVGTYRGWLRKALNRIIVRKSSGLSTPTRDLANALAGHGLKHPDTRILPNVVDTDLFTITVKQRSRDLTKHLVHISVFEDKSKNISGMIRVIAGLSLDREDFRLSLVGEGIDSERIQKQVEELGLGDRVSFTGILEGKELADHLACADLLLLFSNYENIPVVINEAMACGVSVLATNVGGIPEYMEPFSGRLVDPGDEAAFGQALNDFLDEKWETDVQQMREKALKEFSIDAVSDQLLSWYNDILK